MPPGRPHCFRVKDLLFPGPLLVFSLGMTLYVCFSDIGSGMHTSVAVLSGFVTVVFLGFYAWILWQRHVMLESFAYIRGPTYAIMFHRGSYPRMLDPELILDQFKATFYHWQVTFSPERLRSFTEDALFWVWLQPHPVSCGSGSKQIIPGYPTSRSRKIVVGYGKTSESLEATLRHELGHLLQGALTGSWMTTGHHERAKKYDLD